jgi:hypothetical protein
MSSADINHNLKIIRLYADLGIYTPILYEELAKELDLNFDKLSEEGFLDGFISFKLAQNEDAKRIMN